MVVVFGGRVLPLDKQIMLHGNVEARKEHLLEVIGVFIDAKIDQLLTAPPPAAVDGEAPEEPAEAFAPHPHPHEALGERHPKHAAPISAEEYAIFVKKELHLLDNPQAFRAIFD
jgi:hypothetical protein